MSERITLFVDVILPVPIEQVFTYRVPYELNQAVDVGFRVIVPFGKSKLLTGIITSIHQNVPTNYQAKYLEFVLDEQPIITSNQLKLWYWISAYYLAPIGDVMNAALPANFKLASETKIVLHPEFDDRITLSEKEQTVVDVLQIKEELDMKELGELTELKSVFGFVKKLIERKIVLSVEEIAERFKPKTELCVRIEDYYFESEHLEELLNDLSQHAKNEKQTNALLEIIKLASEKGHIGFPIPRKLITDKGISVSILQTLEKKGFVVFERIQIDRLKNDRKATKEFYPLTSAQQTALEEIRREFSVKNVVLLNGVTGSGKTEIYVRLIQEQLEQGNQVLFLLPEIALTTQLIQRLSSFFGNSVGVYHSKFNQNERVEIWNKVLDNDLEGYRIIVGARSSVFLPFTRLGLIIVDEEHESSFKQFDPSPRYNARDVSIILGGLHQAKVLLGSATPSLETYYNVQQEKYGIVELSERYKGLMLPEVQCADLKREVKLKNMKSHFSTFLLEAIEQAISNGEQVILFQNLRGYTPLWMCEVCDTSPRCVNCDVTLTYHKSSNLLKCHYCNYSIPPVGSCSQCGSNRLRMVGFGTEKIEDELQVLLPSLTIKRLDFDSTRSKNAYEELIGDFENRKIDILIGTQMISKGLDFDNVSLVGILDADMLLSRPDFRAYERAYQLMSQVAGRAGRKGKRGRVVIQTKQPDHWVIQLVQQHDFTSFYNQEIIERKNYYYPPFFKMIHFTLKHKDEKAVHQAGIDFSDALKEIFKERVLGPDKPVVGRIHNLYLREIHLKIERSAPDKKVKDKIQELLTRFYTIPNNKSVRISVDVDPQ